MRMHPIASALTRNKTGLVLIALQVALTLAIVVNNVFIIHERLVKMGRPTGTDEANLFMMRSVPFREDRFGQPELQVDLAALRAMPGVLDAVASNSAPLSGGGWSTGVSRERPDPNGNTKSDANSGVYLVDDHALNTLGVKLVAGRNFRTDELMPFEQNKPFEPDVVIVTQSLADKLYPDGNAIGKPIWAFGIDKPATVIGIVERLQAAWVGWRDVENVILGPGLVAGNRYIVRAQPGQKAAVMRDIDGYLRKVNDQRMLTQVRDFDEQRLRSYRRDQSMAIMLTTVIVSLLIITGLGIVGMASFWVTSRTKQIGTRRALGARKADVLRYFQVENLMITVTGLALGALLAYGFNFWLMAHFELPRLAWYYVPAGALALVALGQLAVLGPALRGSSVSPAVATRSV